MAAPNIDINGVRHCLTICGCNNDLREAIIAEGVDKMAQLKYLRVKDVDDMSKRITALPNNQGGARFGQIQANKVKALITWVKERISQGMDLDANDFDQDALDATMDRMEADDRDVDDEIAAKPENFDSVKWVQWRESFENYLSSLTSHNNVPLSYVIRKAIDANYEFETEEEERIYSVAFQGERYLRDRKRVFQLLKGFLVGTDGNTWLGDYEGTTNRRMAYRALCSHYDGLGEKQKRIAMARHTLQDAHY